MPARIHSTSSSPSKAESINSTQAFLQPSHIPVVMEGQASNHVLERSVLSVIEQDMEDLLQYITLKHERLVRTVKDLTAQHERAMTVAGVDGLSAQFEPAPVFAEHEPATVFAADKDLTAQHKPATTIADVDGFTTTHEPATTIAAVSDVTAPHEPATTTPTDLDRGVQFESVIKSPPREPYTVLQDSGRPGNVLASAPWNPKATSPVSSKAQAQSAPSEGVDGPSSPDPEDGPEMTVFVATRSMVTKQSSAVLHFWQVCCKFLKRRRRKSEHLREHLARRSKDVELPRFDAFVGTVIVINAIIMTMELQWHGYLTSVELGFAGEGGWPHAEIVFDVLEHVFTAFFIFELISRVCINGPYYFSDVWNFFDTGLVVISIIDLYILEPLGHGGQGNLTFIRFARLLKFMRVLRIVRVMKLFSSLRVLGTTIISSFSSLIWSMVLLGIIMGMFGLLLCQFLREWILDEKNDPSQREWVFNHYGSSSRAFFTMFEATLSGCWPNYVRPLVDISDWYAVAWIFYVAVVVFAIIRIITALFLKETLQNANDDADMMINEQLKKKQEYLRKLAQAFEVMDQSGDGTVTYAEFENMLCNPSIKAYLSVLDLEVHETETLFRLLDNGDGFITYSEFIAGVLRMKGQARSVDLICLQRDMSRLYEAVMDMSEQMGIRSPAADHKPKQRGGRASRAASLSLSLDLAAVPQRRSSSAVPLVG